MKIGVVTPRYPPKDTGGGSKSTQLLVGNLINRTEHDVEVLAFDGPGGLRDPDYVTREVLEESRNDLMNLKAYRRIKKFADDKDVIHSYNMVFHPAVASIKTVRTVATLNGYKFFYPKSITGLERVPRSETYRTFHNLVCRTMLRRMDKFIPLSSIVKEQYSRILPESKMEVVPNMYDPEFKFQAQPDLKQKEIIYVGRLDGCKGLDRLIDVMTEIPEYNLRIIGEGDRKEKLERMVKSLEIGDRVIFEGYVDHEKLPEYYARAGWFVHPSRWPEPLNRTLFEAMQTETAALCSNMGGAKDVLHNKQIFEEPSEIPEKIRHLDREEIVDRQNSQLEEYSPEKIVNRLEEIYK
jgi:glycosyltransferase involved in cell wall biosynthesis